MFAVLGEDQSDVSTLKVIIKRLAKNDSLSVKGKGYDGGAEMLRKGAKQIELFASEHKCKRFVICYDADGPDAVRRYNEARQKIVTPCRANGLYSIIVPVQEVEAWILADIAAVSNVFKGWSPDEISNPESIASPKEHLEKLSRNSERRPRYSHATHNEKVAQHLDLEKVANKCPSFRPLVEFVEEGKANA